MVNCTARAFACVTLQDKVLIQEHIGSFWEYKYPNTISQHSILM